jgi:hypothetical protein
VNAAAGGEGDLYGVAMTLRFLDEPGTPRLGYDLDNTCTCPTGPGSCRSKKDGKKGPCDDLQDAGVAPTGIDNSTSLIVGVLLGSLDPSLFRLQENLDTAAHGVAVKVSGWNGLADDSDVAVSVYNVGGVDGGKLTYNGSDEVYAAEESILAPPLGSRYYDPRAYVSGGVLVAAVDFNVRVVIPPPGLDAMQEVFAHLHTATLVGHLKKVGDTGLEMLDAQFVGRISQGDVFGQLNRMGLCQGTDIYNGIKDRTCDALDIPSNPANDGKDIACDAISFAMGLVVKPAKLVGNIPTPPYTPPCLAAVDSCQ